MKPWLQFLLYFIWVNISEINFLMRLLLSHNQQSSAIRIKYITIFAITFILEVIIAKYVHDKIIRPYIGDVLVVICLYTFAKSIFLDKIKLLSLYVLILAVIVEILQYFNYAQILFGDNKIAKTLLGSSFDIKDILCYVVGYLIIILIEKISHERKEAKQNENSR